MNKILKMTIINLITLHSLMKYHYLVKVNLEIKEIKKEENCLFLNCNGFDAQSKSTNEDSNKLRRAFAQLLKKPSSSNSCLIPPLTLLTSR